MVDEKILMPKGRLVRCTKCRHSWHAAPPSLINDPSAPEEKSLKDMKTSNDQPKKEVKEQVVKKAEPSEDSAPNSQNNQDENQSDDGLSLAINNRRNRRSRLSSGSKTRNLPAVQKNKNPDKWGWIALAAFSTLMIGGFFLMPSMVTEFWPSSAELYKKINMTTADGSDHSKNKKPAQIPISERLVLKHLQAVSSFKDGVNLLTIAGEVHNLTKESQKSVDISISLVDENSKSVRQWNISPKTKDITANGFISFSSALPNPPLETRDIRVDFVKENEQPSS